MEALQPNDLLKNKEIPISFKTTAYAFKAYMV